MIVVQTESVCEIKGAICEEMDIRGASGHAIIKKGL